MMERRSSGWPWSWRVSGVFLTQILYSILFCRFKMRNVTQRLLALLSLSCWYIRNCYKCMYHDWGFHTLSEPKWMMIMPPILPGLTSLQPNGCLFQFYYMVRCTAINSSHQTRNMCSDYSVFSLYMNAVCQEATEEEEYWQSRWIINCQSDTHLLDCVLRCVVKI